MPWFSLLLMDGVKPYQSYITQKTIRGIFMVNGQNTKTRFLKDTDEKYYVTEDGRVYSDKISKMVMKINDLSGGYVIKRFNKIYSHIFIDEIQDFSGYDLEIFKKICESNNNILLVGDTRQATYSTHFEQKYKEYSNGKIVKYVKDHIPTIDIDDKSLNTTHRNNKEICDFANSIYPEMHPCDSDMNTITGHDGIFWVKKIDMDEYLKKYSPIQLRYSQRTQVNENYSVYSYGTSKGLSFDRVLIFPTKPILDWIMRKTNTLKDESRAKFYVAVTRARYSVAFVYQPPIAPNTKIGKLWNGSKETG
jgi:DNA helicase-2/ATP-dependent DNA helicase PcrA